MSSASISVNHTTTPLQNPCKNLECTWIVVAGIIGGVACLLIACYTTPLYSAAFFCVTASGLVGGGLSGFIIQKIVVHFKHPALPYRAFENDDRLLAAPSLKEVETLFQQLKEQSWVQAWIQMHKKEAEAKPTSPKDESGYISYLHNLLQRGRCFGTSATLVKQFSEIKDLDADSLKAFLQKPQTRASIIEYQIKEFITKELQSRAYSVRANFASALAGNHENKKYYENLKNEHTKALEDQYLFDNVNVQSTIKNIIDLPEEAECGIIEFHCSAESSHVLFFQCKGQLRFYDTYNENCGLFVFEDRTQFLTLLQKHVDSYGQHGDGSVKIVCYQSN